MSILEIAGLFVLTYWLCWVVTTHGFRGLGLLFVGILLSPILVPAACVWLLFDALRKPIYFLWACLTDLFFDFLPWIAIFGYLILIGFVAIAVAGTPLPFLLKMTVPVFILIAPIALCWWYSPEKWSYLRVLLVAVPVCAVWWCTSYFLPYVAAPEYVGYVLFVGPYIAVLLYGVFLRVAKAAQQPRTQVLRVSSKNTANN